MLGGASFGAPFVSIVAGERPDVAGLILAHGFADIPNVIGFRIGASWEKKWGVLGRWFGAAIGHLLWWYADVPEPETKLAALGSQQKVLLLNAASEDLVPLESVAALRAALAKSAAKISEHKIPGAHLRPGEEETLKILLRESIDWLHASGIAAPKASR